MNDYSAESVYELISELGFYLNLIFASSGVFLWVITGGSSSAYELADEVLESNVNSTMLLVWKVQAKTDRLLCYFCCDVFNLRTESVKPLPFNTSTVYSHGFSQVHFHASVPQLSQLCPDGDVCFYLSFAYTRTLFDCGKEFELSMWNSCFVKRVIRIGFVSAVGSNLVDKCHRGFVHELVYKIRYRSDWLFSASIVYLSAKGGSEFFFLLLKCGSLKVPKRVLNEISASTFLIIPTGEVEIYFGVCEQLKDDRWEAFILVTMAPVSLTTIAAPFPGQGGQLHRTAPRPFPITVAVVPFFIIRPDVMRSVEFLELLKVTVWLAVKRCIRSQLLGAKVMVEYLVDLTSEAKIDFTAGSIISMEDVISLGIILVAPEFRQLTQRVVRTVQVHSGDNANCREEKLLETPISIRSAAMLRKICRQQQPWLLGHHLWFSGYWITGLEVHLRKSLTRVVSAIMAADLLLLVEGCTRYDAKRVSCKEDVATQFSSSRTRMFEGGGSVMYPL